MRGKYTRLLTFLVAFSMILSMHVSFAEPTGSDANQVDNWINYFDEDGSKGLIGEKYEPVDTPWEVVDPPEGYEYYAIIVKAGSDQSTSDSSTSPGAIEVGQANLVIRDNIVVGEDIYFTWEDDGETKFKEISHIIVIFIPIQEPVGKIEITKIVEDDEGVVLDDDTTFYFMIQIEEEGAWVDYLEDPIAVTGGESELSGFLPLGEYKVIEVGLDEDVYEVDLPDGDEVTLDEDGQTVTVTFTNTMLDEEEARIEIEKIVENEAGEEINDDTDFYFMIQIEEEGAWVDFLDNPITVEGGNTELSGYLPLGEYKVIEVDLDDDYEVDFEDGIEVTLDIDNQIEEVTFTNTLLDEAERARIEITKIVEDEDGVEIDDDSDFFFMIQVEEEENVWVDFLDDPITVKGGETKLSAFLPLGEYKVIEVMLDDDYEVDFENGIEVILDIDNQIEEVTFTNTLLDDDDEEEESARIRIEKVVEDEDNDVIDDDSDFFFMIRVEEDDEWVDFLDDPITVEGGDTELSGYLPLGKYKVIEVDLDDDYEVDFEDGIEVTLDIDNQIEEVTFTNTLLDDVVDDDDDDNDNDNDRPRRSRPETVVESVTVTPDPTPQAPPAVVVVEQQPESEQEPEVEVVEEVTPQATLPATGASDPTVFAGFGAAFMALGLYLKKKRF